MKPTVATKDDLFGLLELYTYLHDNPMPQIDDDLSALWKGILNDPNHHIIVIKQNGVIVSSCVLIIVPNLTHAQRPYALIENVITTPSHRRLGLASACLDYAREIAVRCGCYKIMLLTGSKDLC